MLNLSNWNFWIDIEEDSTKQIQNVCVGGVWCSAGRANRVGHTYSSQLGARAERCRSGIAIQIVHHVLAIDGISFETAIVDFFMRMCILLLLWCLFDATLLR